MKPSRHGAPAWVLDVGLIAIVLLATTFVLLSLCLHILLSIYDGRFSRRRTWTWLLLLGSLVAAVAAGLLAVMLPLGQTSLAAAALVQRWFGDQGLYAIERISTALPALSVLPVMLFCLDVVAMHAGRVRRWSHGGIAAFLVFLIAAIVVPPLALQLIMLFPQPLPEALMTPLKITPSIAEAPFYAILRAFPSKSFALVAMFVTLLLPMTCPWTVNWRSNASASGLVWALLCLLLTAAWVSLTLLGLQPPTDGVIWLSRLALAYVYCFFLVVPLVMARLGEWQDRSSAATL